MVFLVKYKTDYEQNKQDVCFRTAAYNALLNRFVVLGFNVSQPLGANPVHLCGSGFHIINIPLLGNNIIQEDLCV